MTEALMPEKMLADAFRLFVEQVKTVSYQTGTCCCGTPISDHNPMYDGHSPRDEAEYYQCSIVQDALDALTMFDAAPARTPAGENEDNLEIAAKAYADATGYYVPFHRGLSSPSADKIRTGIRAALAALQSKEPGA
jgi:hypothetical protein